MSHASFEASCNICKKIKDASTPAVYENALWHVRPIDPPCAVPGWMLMITRRHVPGVAQFDEREAASFGPTMRHLQKILLEVTGALRIYVAAMGESSPHFHAHLVPRYASMPRDAKGFAVFDLQRAAAAGEVQSNGNELARVTQAYANALSAAPLPAF
jgi:diadenosine tetraphosphate (Ap4A) HIT family hydrolase